MPEQPKDSAPAAAAKPTCTIIKQKHSRWWAVRDPDDEMVCAAVYRKGRARRGANGLATCDPAAGTGQPRE